jgi:hypothetical protein
MVPVEKLLFRVMTGIIDCLEHPQSLPTHSSTNWAEVSIKMMPTIYPTFSPQEWIHLKTWRGLSSGTLLCARLLEIDWCFRGAYCLHYQDLIMEAVNHLWNTGQFLPHYTVQHPRRQSPSFFKKLKSHIYKHMLNVSLKFI